MSTTAPDTKALALPRLLYKGRDDSQDGAPAPDTVPTETRRVETKEALDAALKDGWRLHRTLEGGTPPEPTPLPAEPPSTTPAPAEEPPATPARRR